MAAARQAAAEVLRAKYAVRERDGWCCAQCGITNADHIERYGKILDVHRTTPGSEYSVEPGVCVTLCRACHGPKPRRRRHSTERLAFWAGAAHVVVFRSVARFSGLKPGALFERLVTENFPDELASARRFNPEGEPEPAKGGKGRPKKSG